MEDLKNGSELAYNWTSTIPPSAWARHAFDTNYKTNLVVNNISEVFNKMILDVRSKPIRTTIDGIRSKLMVKYSGIRRNTRNILWEITPHYSEKLEESKKYSRKCVARNADLGLFQVISGSRVHAVNLTSRTCGCKE
jgi:hypothetical protein